MTMLETEIDLYCALMGDKYGMKVKGGEPPKGILAPRWKEGQTYFNKKLNKDVPVPVDVRYELDDKGAPVLMNDKEEIVKEGGKPVLLRGYGTSLHDVAGWFNVRDFHIPKGTKYSDQIEIVRDGKKKTSEATGVSGYHYQLEVRTRMTLTTFLGYLDNMARAAVVQQMALAGK